MCRGYTLTIDQGNSRTKVTIFDQRGEVVRRGVHDTFDIETLTENYGAHDPQGIIYSSVRHMDIRLIESIRHMWPERLHVLTHRTDTGIHVCYGTPETLGSDRVAACAGARALYPGECVLTVDAGTAITLDVVDSEGYFRAGNISAGISTRLHALHDATAALPLVEVEGEVPEFGQDTRTALLSGAVMGAVWETEGAYRTARRLYGCNRLVLTGGDAPVLVRYLDGLSANIAVEPDLVAIGLNSILRRTQNHE